MKNEESRMIKRIWTRLNIIVAYPLLIVLDYLIAWTKVSSYKAERKRTKTILKQLWKL